MNLVLDFQLWIPNHPNSWHSAPIISNSKFQGSMSTSKRYLWWCSCYVLVVSCGGAGVALFALCQAIWMASTTSDSIDCSRFVMSSTCLMTGIGKVSSSYKTIKLYKSSPLSISLNPQRVTSPSTMSYLNMQGAHITIHWNHQFISFVHFLRLIASMYAMCCLIKVLLALASIPHFLTT
jgi:hypothetical protein